MSSRKYFIHYVYKHISRDRNFVSFILRCWSTRSDIWSELWRVDFTSGTKKIAIFPQKKVQTRAVPGILIGIQWFLQDQCSSVLAFRMFLEIQNRSNIDWIPGFRGVCVFWPTLYIFWEWPTGGARVPRAPTCARHCVRIGGKAEILWLPPQYLTVDSYEQIVFKGWEHEEWFFCSPCR